MDKFSVLKQYFGHSEFRSGQGQIIDNILSGRDCLGVMPTGAGKSMCYQIPAIMLGGTTVVISPLISLMKDQVESLREAGVNAAFINSSLSQHEYYSILRWVSTGECRLLYVAPERLLIEEFLELCRSVTIPLVAVDEAHCVSQWGQDFRKSYLQISEFIARLNKRPVLAAFTATATSIVMRDIRSYLGLNNPYEVKTGFDRKNLYFEVRPAAPSQKCGQLLQIIRESQGRSAIVYCSTRKNVDTVSEFLNLNGIKAASYHAGLSDDVRKAAQEDFEYDRVDVVVATNAFGMGIDKSNVSLVVHYNMPKDIESYYQEAGRAGRDGSSARCILLYSRSDIMIIKRLIEYGHQDSELSSQQVNELKAKDYKRLRTMADYCESSSCLRKYILNYFGDKAEEVCGNCSVCNSRYDISDITVAAQKILSCIFRLKQRDAVGSKALIADILCGNHTPDVEAGDYSALSTFGIIGGKAEAVIGIMEYLAENGYINVSAEGGCTITELADEFIKNRRTLLMKRPKQSGGSSSEMTYRSDKPAEENPELFGQLSALRRKISATLGVPAFVVFADATLREMAAKQPVTEQEFLNISGVGSRKAERYGSKFMAVISEYRREQGKTDAPQQIAPDKRLLQLLQRERSEIAAEYNLPDIMIFTDEALIDMSEKQPTTLEQFLKINGVGKLKAERYGNKFMSAISDYKKTC